MSHAAVQAILRRTLMDEQFRGRLLAEPETVLADYDLTTGEASALRLLSVETGTADNPALDQRITKRPLWTMA